MVSNNETASNNGGVVNQVDIKKMIMVVVERIATIIVITLLCGAAVFAFSSYFITPKYASSITMFVNNRRDGGADTETKTLTSDIMASQQLVPTYIAMITSDNILQDVADKYNDRTGETYSVRKLKEMVTAESVNQTEILKVTVKTPNAASSQELANIVAEVAPRKIQSFIEKSDVRIIDHATLSTNPVSPNVRLNTILGILMGMVISVAYVLFRELFDIRVKSVDDLAQKFQYPVLGSIPEIFVAYDLVGIDDKGLKK